jgi:hypothetical protein
VICESCGSEHERDGDLCFRCHVRGISFGFSGSVSPGRKNWNRTANEWRLEHFGTTDEKELGRRGIERV